jgi:hypothetical protein
VRAWTPSRRGLARQPPSTSLKSTPASILAAILHHSFLKHPLMIPYSSRLLASR